MKLLNFGKAVAAILLAMFCAGTVMAEDAKASGSAAKSIVVSDVGFATPESVEYYAAEDVYLVTNINGSPFAADGNGFISKIKPDGSVIDLKWIDGTRKGVTLNGPKGAAIAGKNLFVADGDQVQVFSVYDLRTHLRQKALVLVREFVEQILGNQRIQYGIPEKFKPFVIDPDVFKDSL